jgi:hypothetical protein
MSSLLQYPEVNPFIAYSNSFGQFVLSDVSVSGFTTTVFIQPATTTTTTSASGTTTTITGGNVSITLEDGSTVVVFNSVQDGLTCLQSMHSQNMYYLQASDDIMIINVSGVKLLILQTTFMNQKLMNNYTFAYLRGKVRAIHRNLSTIKTLTDALVSVGDKLNGSPFSNNYSLQGAMTTAQMPHIQIFDLNYLSTPAGNTGSKLEDATPIVYVDSSASAPVSGI